MGERANGRPRIYDHDMTSTDYSRVSRTKRKMKTVELPPESFECIAMLRRDGGDVSNAATVMRVLREACEALED